MGSIYSNLKLFRHPDRLAALLENRPAPPVHVRIKPINRCNHNCWYCAYRADNLALGEDMDLEDRIPLNKMLEIADDLVEMRVAAVTFSGGGEPLLYKELPDIIEKLRSGGVRIGALSNGSNLRGRMADAFARHGAWIRISLDAWDNASYAASRGAGDDAFDRLMDNIGAFTARRSPCVLGISLIVGESNCEHIADVCAMLKERGANHVKISGAVVSNDRDENNNYHRKIKVIVLDQIKMAKKLDDINFKIINHYHELTDRFEKHYKTCPFANFLTVIGADCRVYACQDKAYTQSGLLGSIAERRFADFWMSEELKNRLATLDPSVTCTHHCVAHAKNMALHEVLSADPEHGRFV